MKRITVNLENISDLDLKFARNPKVIDLLDEIIPLSLDERTQALDELRAKIQQRKASLFEEHVKVALYKGRKAEWIRVIHKNLPHIEAQLDKHSTPKSASQSPPNILPEQQHAPQPSAPFQQKSHSELLEFLSTQTPPKEPKSSRPPRQKAGAKKSSSFTFQKKDMLAGGLVLALILFSLFRGGEEESTARLDTFYAQAHEQEPDKGVPRELQDQIEMDFNTAAQILRFGDFERGEAALLEIAETYPVSEYAESAYILIADMYRLRKHDPDTALQYYQQFLEKFPQSKQYAVTQLKMGFTHEDMADRTLAEELYRQLIQEYGEQTRIGQLAYERLQRLERSGVSQ